MRPKTVIWGAGMQARVVADIIRQQGEYELVGFLDSMHPERRGESFVGSTILGGEEQLNSLLEQGIEHIAFGFGHNSNRLRLAEQVQNKGFKLATTIHPAASIAPDIAVGEGSVIKAGVVIDTAVSIGRLVMLSSNVSIAHGSVLEDGARLSAGANIAGSVHVGRGAWIAVGVNVKPEIKIGDGALVGIGAVVIDDIPEDSVAFGVPAKVMRKTRPNEV